MSRSSAFIDRETFEACLQEVGTASGEEYEDVTTVYGDLSRLVVAWAASTRTSDLVRRYNELGWGGTANARAMREAARLWMRKYHPDRLTELDRRAGRDV